MTKEEFINAYEIHEKILNQAKEKAIKIIDLYGAFKPFASFNKDSIRFDLRNNLIHFTCQPQLHSGIVDDYVSLDFLFVEFDVEAYAKLRKESEKVEKDMYELLKRKYEPRPSPAFTSTTEQPYTFTSGAVGSVTISANANPVRLN